MAFGSLLPLLILGTTVSFAKAQRPFHRCQRPHPLQAFNFSADCGQNTDSLNCTVTNVKCAPCNAINTTTGPLCPQCNLQCARWLDDLEANLIELARGQLAKECSTCHPCDFRRCIDVVCIRNIFVNTPTDQLTRQLCLLNLCPNKVGDSTDADVTICTEYCNVIESGCGHRQRVLCRRAQEKYCGVPGRGKNCAVTCAIHDNCGDIVDAILDGGKETVDSFSAALSLTAHHSLPEKAGGCHRPLKSRLNTLKHFVHGVSYRHFNRTSQGDLSMVFENFLSDDRREEWTSTIPEMVYAQDLLENIEQAALFFAKGGDPFNFYGNGIVMNTFYAVEGWNTYSFLQNSFDSSSTATIEVPVQHRSQGRPGTTKVSYSCHVAISAALIRNLNQYLHNESQYNTSSNITMINTHIVTLEVNGMEDFDESNPVRLIFTPARVGTFSSISCVFWDFNISQWSTVNVTTEVNDSHYICSTTHLTSFAVLVTVSAEADEQKTSEDLALSIVSYVGCAVSIICLTLAILFLVCMRKAMNKGCLTYIHLNLCTALLLAMVTFIAGIQAGTEVDWLCTVVAALLQYLFLCVFCWMLAEGIMLYLLVVRVFGTAADKWYYLLPLGWGLPVPIVAVSIGIKHQEYGNDNYCWMSVDDGVIWAFAAPVLMVILINGFILAITVASVVRVRKSSKKVTTSHLIVTTLKLSIILLPLLGLSWIFGLLAVNDNTTVFAWLFCIFNSFQGFYLFVIHVARNEKFQAVLNKKCLKRRWHTKKPSRSEDKCAAVNGSTPKLRTLTAITEIPQLPQN